MNNTPVLLVNSLNYADVVNLLRETHELHRTTANPDPIGLRYMAGEEPTYNGPLQYPKHISLTVVASEDNFFGGDGEYTGDIELNIQSAGITLVNQDSSWEVYGPINSILDVPERPDEEEVEEAPAE